MGSSDRSVAPRTSSNSIMKLFVLAVCLVAMAAVVPRVRRQSTPDNFQLVSNATVVLGREVSTGFDCASRSFGFYADPANGCQIFHICHPQETEEGPVTTMYSFLCGLGTIFDQSSLTCNFPEEAAPCDSAESLYNINEYFGKDDLEFRSGLNDI